MNKDILEFLRQNRFVTLSTDGIKLWTTKVFYALDHGIIFFVEKTGLTIQNINKNPEISYEIDKNELSIIIQGTGKVNILGNATDYKKESDLIISKSPEDKKFIEHIYVARLIPDLIRVTDMRNTFKKYNEDINLDELNELK